MNGRPENMRNVPIGTVLQNMGYITSQQMQKALDYQKEHKEKRLGQVLIDLNFITEKQMLEALALRLDLRTVEMSEVNVDIEAVEKIPRQLAEKYGILAIGFNGPSLRVLVNDPMNYYALEDIRQITGQNLEVLLVELVPLQKAIAYYYAEVGARRAAHSANQMALDAQLDVQPQDEQDDSDAPIVRLLDSLIQRAVSNHASDIHIEPFEDHTLVRMRVDGVILEYTKLRRSLHQPLCARIKILSNLDITERRLPQDGHFRANISPTESINIRVSILPTVFGEKAVIRLLDSRAVIEQADHFGMEEENYHRFVPMLDCPNGIIYITGPTGSGKTTTLYMVLELLAKRQVNIATIEDPVEKTLAHVSQTQVNTTAGLTFDTGLRALLRQDPDIIMVGETRDAETASIAVRAAITGHVVFSTLHTNDAVSSIVRLEDMGVERYLLANSLVGVVAQRLVRKICPNCRRKVAATATERQRLGQDVEYVWRGEGCPECGNTGYNGRIAIHEVLSVDKQMRAMISQGVPVNEIEAYARRTQGMTSLHDAGLALVLAGKTTPEELLKVTYYTD